MSTLIEYEVSPGVWATKLVDDAAVSTWQEVGWAIPGGVPIGQGPQAGVDAEVAALIAQQSSSTSRALSVLVGAAVANIVAGAPTLLNTLQELAAAVANDPTFGADVLAQINTLATQVAAAYVKPSSGIPLSDLSAAVLADLITTTDNGDGTATISVGGAVPTIAVTVTDNLDGTFTATGPGVTDNGDGTFTATGPGVTDNGDGTYTLTTG